MRRAIWGIVIASWPACAQAPAFDVASVKVPEPVPFGQNININLGTVQHGELTLTNTTLSECIRFAYDLVSDDLVGAPDWVKSREFRYDIVAKSAPDTPRPRMLEMLQTLLTERFKLEMHREPRVLAHYELVVAKTGLKIRESKPDAPKDLKYGTAAVPRVASPWMPMSRFTMLLSRQLRQAVLDKTGLTAAYDVDLQWRRETAPGEPAEESGPSIFSAIQDQLGLKLEPHKSPVEILVIDRAEKVPVAN